MEKVGFFVEAELPPNVKKLLLNLGKMLHEDFELDMIGKFTPSEELMEYYDHICYAGMEGAEGLQRIKQGYINCREYCMREDPDALIQLIIYPVYAPIVSFVGADLSVPTAVRIPEDTFREYRVRDHNILEFSKILFMNNMMGRLPLKKADRVIVLTEHLRNEAISKGCSEDKIRKIPQPIDTEKFSPVDKKTKTRIRGELGLPHNKKIALTVGRLDRTKGLPTLESAVKKVDHDDIVFCLVGKGQFGEIMENRYSKKVIHAGFVPFEEVEKYYNASDLLIHPSSLEGLPNVVLEAQASGLPVMVRKADYTEELGVPTFSTSHELVELLNSEWRFTPLSEEYNWSILKQKYIRFLKELINTSK